jgi:hypothetical protein
MEEKDSKEFSRACLLWVTSCSFFIFYILLKKIDGTQMPLFKWIGIAGFIGGIFFAAIGLLNREAGKKRPTS